MTVTRENIVLVHWHDLGRHLGAYGHSAVRSPNLDQLAAEGFLFTDAHATAPLCSPSRGSLFTGRYPHSNGLIGLAHHGWEYRPDVRTLPSLLSESGWYTVLYGMQHETSHPPRLGFDEYDVSNAFCEYVTAQAKTWLRERDERPFLLTAGFFETHRPYPADRYTPTPVSGADVPSYLPDTPAVRADLAEFYGSIEVADAAFGELLETLSDTGLDETTWVVFLTDHGPAFPRAKSTLYSPGTGISLIIRPPRSRKLPPRTYDDLFSGVDLVPTLLALLGLDVPEDIEGISHAAQLLAPVDEPVRDEVYATKTYHDSFDPIRAIRTKDYSYIENYAHRPELDLPWDIADSPSGQAVAGSTSQPRARRELYDLRSDPAELVNVADDPRYDAVGENLALRLNEWRRATGDVIPSEFVGTRTSEQHTTAYARLHGINLVSRFAKADERGYDAAAQARPAAPPRGDA
ncbi:MAG: sulfatase [Nocardiaceae bacterium]|nr:sulfatase [Nocardiaceae bacterium]